MTCKNCCLWFLIPFRSLTSCALGYCVHALNVVGHASSERNSFFGDIFRPHARELVGSRRNEGLFSSNGGPCFSFLFSMGERQFCVDYRRWGLVFPDPVGRKTDGQRMFSFWWTLITWSKVMVLEGAAVMMMGSETRDALLTLMTSFSGWLVPWWRYFFLNLKTSEKFVLAWPWQPREASAKFPSGEENLLGFEWFWVWSKFAYSLLVAAQFDRRIWAVSWNNG